MEETGEIFTDKALRIVYEFEDSTAYEKEDFDVAKENLRIVWFTKTLQNWKAIVANLDTGGKLYEVTYNGNKGETYIDVYKKIYNDVVTD